MKFYRKDNSLKNKVYTELKEMIINGDLESRKPIKQKEANEIFGVSGTPFREAVQILESEGWVYSIPNKGVYVSPVTEKDIDDAFEIREYLEIGIAKKLAMNKNPIVLEKLEENIYLMEKTVKELTDIEFTRLDWEFHSIINTSSNNQKLIQINSNIYDLMRRFGNLTLKRKERRNEVIEEHKEILKALENGDVEKAIKNHLSNVKKSLINLTVVEKSI